MFVPIDREFQIQVNFSSVHSTYSAYGYTVKEDTEPLLSYDHPDLNDSHEPRTEKALGVWLSVDPEATATLNYNEKLDKIRNILSS